MNCQFCVKSMVNAGALSIHEKHCNNNPNRTQRYRSPNAGAKKGSTPWNKGSEVGRYAKWDENFSLDKILVENSTYARKNLKRRILENNLIEYRCACCGIGPEWNGKSMPLILDHINGVNNDNRLENLRFVCSNCDTQLPTYKSKNKRKSKPTGDGTCLENS